MRRDQHGGAADNIEKIKSALASLKADAESLGMEIDPVAGNPKQFRDLWDKLSQEDKDFLYSRDHSVGNHPGMPFVDRDTHNQQHLGELIGDHSEQYRFDATPLRRACPPGVHGGQDRCDR
ncbi:hypothetical protein [Mycolicibacterium sarraceniae]|uniref:Uncharacterized protein n=1 Tax=Mycolicibacterium sarraceniae TaxID=1534348 RepID=A0A7I7SK93_9MYCO|nr:hypothetical protein [Mycolicibacterium sarraceniae]BBY57153.1 hypothetical protein MSAR_02890 [Mycolicibacterium sarraceniae]